MSRAKKSRGAGEAAGQCVSEKCFLSRKQKVTKRECATEKSENTARAGKKREHDAPSAASSADTHMFKKGVTIFFLQAQVCKARDLSQNRTDKIALPAFFPGAPPRGTVHSRHRGFSTACFDLFAQPAGGLCDTFCYTLQRYTMAPFALMTASHRFTTPLIRFFTILPSLINLFHSSTTKACSLARVNGPRSETFLDSTAQTFSIGFHEASRAAKGPCAGRLADDELVLPFCCDLRKDLIECALGGGGVNGIAELC